MKKGTRISRSPLTFAPLLIFKLLLHMACFYINQKRKKTQYLVKLPALPNLADIKNPFLRDIFAFESFLQ